MAIYDDDFQGYSLGAAVPFGQWQLDPAAITNVIVAGSGPTGTTQSYRLFGDVVLNPLVPGYVNAFTEFVAIRKLQAGTVLTFSNGPNLASHTFTILAIKVELDSTLTVVGPDNTPLANSIDAWFEYNAVNFLQINVQLTDVTITGVKYIHIECQIALNGVKVIDFNTTTTTPVTQLTNGTSEVNRFGLNGAAFYSAYTLDTLQAINAYPHPGTPKARANQAAVEVNILPDTAKIHALQAAIELDELPDTTLLRIIQALIEVDLLQGQGIRAEYIHRRHFPGD